MTRTNKYRISSDRPEVGFLLFHNGWFLGFHWQALLLEEPMFFQLKNRKNPDKQNSLTGKHRKNLIVTENQANKL